MQNKKRNIYLAKKNPLYFNDQIICRYLNVFLISKTLIKTASPEGGKAMYMLKSDFVKGSTPEFFP